MSAVSGTSVLGASLGSSGVRSVISDNTRPGCVLEVHEPVASRPAPNGLAPDPWDAVITSVHNLASEYASADFYPVLALRESDPRTAYDQDFSDGVVLVSELGAQLGALQETGVLAGEHCVALFDVGASGTSVSVVDVDSGSVLAARRTDELSGHYCDRVLCEHLIATFGAAEALTVESRSRLVHDVRAGRHELSRLRSVPVLGPFVGGRASLWRGDLDDLIRESVYRAVTMAVDVFDAVGAQGIHIDAIVAVGGGANMQIVRQVLFDAVSMPVFVPEQPELLAAHGAAGIARTVGLRPASTQHDAPTDRFAAVDGDSAEIEAVTVAPMSAVVSKRPRHSDTSARRTTRANKSRHLGGALAALVAVCAAGTVAAAATQTTDDDPAPSVDTSQDAPQTARSQSVVPAADGSPADPSLSSSPLTTTTESTSPPLEVSTTSPSSGASSTPDAASTTTRRTAATTSATSTTDESTIRERPTRDRSTPTTTVPPATTTTRPAPTTTRPTSTTRPTRPFDFPFPDFGLPGR